MTPAMRRGGVKQRARGVGCSEGFSEIEPKANATSDAASREHDAARGGVRRRNKRTGAGADGGWRRATAWVDGLRATAVCFALLCSPAPSQPRGNCADTNHHAGEHAQRCTDSGHLGTSHCVSNVLQRGAQEGGEGDRHVLIKHATAPRPFAGGFASLRSLCVFQCPCALRWMPCSASLVAAGGRRRRMRRKHAKPQWARAAGHRRPEGGAAWW